MQCRLMWTQGRVISERERVVGAWRVEEWRCSEVETKLCISGVTTGRGEGQAAGGRKVSVRTRSAEVAMGTARLFNSVFYMR